jgi:hypothetical protein
LSEKLDNFNFHTFSKIPNIKTFDSTLYTIITPEQIKTRSTEIIQNAFYFENGKQRYKFICLGPE